MDASANRAAQRPEAEPATPQPAASPSPPQDPVAVPSGDPPALAPASSSSSSSESGGSPPSSPSFSSTVAAAASGGAVGRAKKARKGSSPPSPSPAPTSPQRASADDDAVPVVRKGCKYCPVETCSRHGIKKFNGIRNRNQHVRAHHGAYYNEHFRFRCPAHGIDGTLAELQRHRSQHRARAQKLGGVCPCEIVERDSGESIQERAPPRRASTPTTRPPAARRTPGGPQRVMAAPEMLHAQQAMPVGPWTRIKELVDRRNQAQALITHINQELAKIHLQVGAEALRVSALSAAGVAFVVRPA